MSRWLDLRSMLLALAFGALGFMAADRMTVAEAAPAPANAFAGGSALAVYQDDSKNTYAVVLRDNKLYTVQLGGGGGDRPIATLRD